MRFRRHFTQLEYNSAETEREQVNDGQFAYF